VFAATMSTADSQIISCTAAITDDLLDLPASHVSARKVATACVTAVALGIALTGPTSVLALVLHAWSAMAVTIGSAVVGRLLFGPLPLSTLVVSTVLGLATLVAYRAFSLHERAYELLPGMLVAVGSMALLRRRPMP
jgi:Na+/proline symporter